MLAVTTTVPATRATPSATTTDTAAARRGAPPMPLTARPPVGPSLRSGQPTAARTGRISSGPRTISVQNASDPRLPRSTIPVAAS